MHVPGRGVEHDRVVSIRGTDYRISLFSPDRGTKVLARLLKLLGEPMAMMAGVAGNADKLQELMPKAARALIERMDEDQVLELLKVLTEGCCTRDKKAISFNHEFLGRLGDMAILVKEVIEFQFEDFFGALSGLLPGKGAAEDAAELPSESI